MLSPIVERLLIRGGAGFDRQEAAGLQLAVRQYHAMDLEGGRRICGAWIISLSSLESNLWVYRVL
jgi:hypothetical protein